MHTILIVDDESLIRDSLEVAFIDEGFRVFLSGSGKDALKKVDKYEPEVVLLDIKLPDMSGIDVLQKIRQDDNETVIIMMTAYASVDSAVNAMKMGAFDYLGKPFQIQNAISIVKLALESRSLKREVQLYTRSNQKRYDLRNLIGNSPEWQKVLATLQKIANTEANTVLITGESGTGKELAARAIHHNSTRSGKPFVDINCSAIPDNLLESELFGYQKGAFTDAKRTRIGLIEEANGGTLFLDEIGDLEISLQGKLLRVLEERVLRRIGSTQNVAVDVRVIAATNQDLAQLIEEGRFRRDLFYRLNIIHVHLPPLRERGEDTIVLARHFIDEFSRAFRKQIQGLDKEVEEIFRRYSWKGNVRELKNFMERIVLLEHCDIVRKEHLPPELYQFKSDNDSGTSSPSHAQHEIDGTKSLDQMVAEMQIQLIQLALEKTGGSKTEAAKLLGIKRLALYHLMRKHNIR